MESQTAAIEIVLLAGLGLVLAVLVWLVIGLRGRAGKDSAGDVQSVLTELKAELIQKQMDGLVSLRESLDSANSQLSQRLAENNQTLDRRLELFGEIENRLGSLSQQTENIEKIGANIQSLSELLRPPQLRGALGEILLENLLGQILPGALYDSQVTMAGGQRVDATVKVGDRLMPIDSKFPLESFKRWQDEPDDTSAKAFTRDLRKHIDAIANKYLRPDEGTTDFAVMYIPSEAVYYSFISRDDNEGLEYALSQKVIPSSPGNLYAFLCTVRATHAQSNLSQQGRELMATVERLVKSLEQLKKHHERIASSHRNIGNALDRSQKEATLMATDLSRLQQPGSGSDTENPGESGQNTLF